MNNPLVHMNRTFFLLLIAGTILSSCKKELTPTLSGDDRFGIEHFDFEYLTSKAKFKYQNGKKKITATATFRMKKDSLIWVSISPGLGIEAARLLVSREGFQVLDKIKKDHYVYDYLTLSEQYGFEVNFELVQALVVGNVLFEPKKRRHITDEGRFYSYSQEEGIYGINQFIGKHSKKLERLNAYQTDASNSILVNYGDFEDVGIQRAAQKIRAKVRFEENKDEDVVIDIEYNQMLVQAEPLKFPFHVSSRYTRK